MSTDEKSLKISHFLGVDYGETDVGLALADEETRVAYRLKTLKNNKNFLQELAKIIESKNVGTVIIGIPSHVNRKEVEYKGEEIGEIVKKTLGVKVEYQNEMFTTKIAQANLIEKGMKKIKRYDDQEAARIILQEWLDSRK
jgi:putative transcription antitermination factor YqgF